MSPLPATAMGREVDSIALALSWVTAFLMLLVVSLLGYFAFKYRRGSPADRSNRRSFSWPVEIFNFGSILLIGLVFFVWSGKAYYQQFAAPAGALDLYVIGKQWLWIFQYPGGPQQIGRIKVPLERPVRLLLNSADVIHSFYVPAFRLKQDAVPGRYTSLWFQATRLGEFDVLCTEFCGTSHSGMRAVIEVVPAAEFDAYHSGAQSGPAAGAEVYRRMGCATCHETGGKIAPLLAEVFGSTVSLSDGSRVQADENYLRHALLEPASQLVRGYGPLMPTYQGVLSEAEIASLIDYLKSLPKRGAP